jgi:asparagine synthase (glutamine-hydrolysing)
VATGLANLALRAVNGSAASVPRQTRAGKLVDIVAARGRLPELYQVQYALFTRSFQGELLATAAPEIRYGMRETRLEEMRTLVEGRSIRDAISALEFAMFLEQRLLRDTDAASMASSLEVRVPLIDHVVLEAVGRLPEDVRFAAETKRALRVSAMRDLPRELFDRPKAGFVLPIEVWCRSRLGTEIEETLLDAPSCERVGFEPQAVSRLWSAFKESAPGVYWSRLWSVFALAWWARRHGARIG